MLEATTKGLFSNVQVGWAFLNIRRDRFSHKGFGYVPQVRADIYWEDHSGTRVLFRRLVFLIHGLHRFRDLFTKVGCSPVKISFHELARPHPSLDPDDLGFVVDPHNVIGKKKLG